MKQWKGILRAVIFCIIGIVITILITPIFIPKWVSGNEGFSYIRKGFYDEERNTIDVFFVGDSNVYRAVTPMMLWEKSGITSYDLAGPVQKMWYNYYLIKECLKYQTPKIIVLEMNSAFDETQAEEAFSRKFFDTMKLGPTKIEAIFDKSFENSIKEKLTYIFPLLRYHSRWSELNEKDFSLAYSNYHNYNKGFDMVTKFQVPSKKRNQYLKENNTAVIPEIGDKCTVVLDKIIELCKKNKIQLIFLSIPSTTTSSEMKTNYISEYAHKKGLPYLNMNEKVYEINLEWETDWSDLGHLNLFGAEKITYYINDYLKEYKLNNNKNDKRYQQWNKDFSEYLENRNVKIKMKKPSTN